MSQPKISESLVRHYNPAADTDLAIDTLERARKATIVSTPHVAAAMWQLQFSLKQDRQPVDKSVPSEEREKVPTGFVGTEFGRVAVKSFVAKLGGPGDPGRIAAGLAVMLGAGTVDMLVLQTELSKRHERHEARRASLQPADIAGGVAAKRVSDALVETGTALKGLAGTPKAAQLAGMILHNIPRCEKHYRQEKHPFPEEMALIRAVQFTVSAYAAKYEEIHAAETERRSTDKGYNREQRRIETERYVDAEPVFTRASPGIATVPQSALEIAVQNLEPYVKSAARLENVERRMAMEERHYPEELRKIYVDPKASQKMSPNDRVIGTREDANVPHPASYASSIGGRAPVREAGARPN